MTKYIFILTMLINSVAYSQNTFNSVIKDSIASELLSGATANLKGTSNGAGADKEGKITINNIPNGKQTIVFRYIGYEKLELEFNFPLEQ